MVSLILTVLVVVFFSSGLLDHIKAPPVAGVPISISPPGRIETNFHVNMKSGFELLFLFDREGHSLDEMEKAIYGSGGYIPLTWEIDSLEGECIAKGEGMKNRGTGTASDEIEEWLEYNIRLSQGDYRLILQITQDSPAFKNIETRIQLKHSRGFSECWSLAWLIATLFLMMSDIVLGVILVKKMRKEK